MASLLRLASLYFTWMERNTRLNNLPPESESAVLGKVQSVVSVRFVVVSKIKPSTVSYVVQKLELEYVFIFLKFFD